MTRKVRHPYQILEASEMAVGEQYAFVYASIGGNSASYYAMGGVFGDTLAAARRLGHDLDNAKPPTVEMLVADAPKSVVTVHMDGWRRTSEAIEYPTLMYWSDGFGCGWDEMSIYLGSAAEKTSGSHSIVVPTRQWELDPCLHVADWSNPDGAVERALVEDAAGWEHRMRAKAHAAMAKALGF